MLQGIEGLLPCPTTPSVLHTNLVKTTKMLMPCLRIKWLEAVHISSQSVHAVCEGVQAPHGKIETLCHGTNMMGVLTQDNMTPGMTPLEWSQAQAQDPCNVPNS